MLKILTVFFFCVSVLQVQTDRPPGRFKYEDKVNHFQHKHLINMTEALCKDATYKLRMADLVQQTYKTTRGYELGIIAAGIMDKFRHMIRIYRFYSNAKSFKSAEHNITEIMNGYSAIQSDYNEIVAEAVLFYQILHDHMARDAANLERAKYLSKKYRVPVETIHDMISKGMDPADYGLKRRSLQTETELPKYVEKRPEEWEDNPRKFLLEDPTFKNLNVWTPKKDKNTQEEEYKKKLRYIMWAEKWNGFNGETEGINIADTIARLGFANDSDFLLKDLKGPV